MKRSGILFFTLIIGLQGTIPAPLYAVAGKNQSVQHDVKNEQNKQANATLVNIQSEKTSIKQKNKKSRWNRFKQMVIRNKKQLLIGIATVGSLAAGLAVIGLKYYKSLILKPVNTPPNAPANSPTNSSEKSKPGLPIKVDNKKAPHKTSNIIPIIYHPDYNITFGGIENSHPFDTKKYGKIARYLQENCNIQPNDFYKPSMITDADLKLVHSEEYLKSLNASATVAKVAELPILASLPNWILKNSMLKGMRYATAGTVVGAQLAMTQGWAINLTGGYHHAKKDNGEGFCFFADIPLAVHKLHENNPALKVLVVDLDAHQGNGVESILGPNQQVHIFDMYSRDNYPRDNAVFQYINYNHPLDDAIQDRAYLNILTTELPKAIEASKPDLIIYNAGTDIFEQDKLGKMSVTKNGIIERDHFVFSEAFNSNTPILMVLSGGYSKESAGIVGASIENILKKFDLINR